MMIPFQIDETSNGDAGASGLLAFTGSEDQGYRG